MRPPVSRRQAVHAYVWDAHKMKILCGFDDSKGGATLSSSWVLVNCPDCLKFKKET